MLCELGSLWFVVYGHARSTREGFSLLLSALVLWLFPLGYFVCLFIASDGFRSWAFIRFKLPMYVWTLGLSILVHLTLGVLETFKCCCICCLRIHLHWVFVPNSCSFSHRSLSILCSRLRPLPCEGHLEKEALIILSYAVEVPDTEPDAIEA